MRLETGDVDPIELDRAASRRRFAGDAAQQRGLAGAVATEHGDQLSIGDLQRDAVENVAGAVKRIDAIEAQHH